MYGVEQADARETKNGIQNGHSKTLKYISPGTPIYNLRVVPGKNGKILCAAGSSGQITRKTNKLLAKRRLKSGHYYRWFDIKTMATTGTVSNKFSGRRGQGQGNLVSLFKLITHEQDW